jgi:hypothetical protein
VSYIVRVVGFRFYFAFFTFRCGRRRDTRSGRFPNETAPFIGFAEQLKCSERVARMTLDAKHFRDYL